MLVDDIDNLNYDSLDAVAHLRASDRYREIMQVTHTTSEAVALVLLCTICLYVNAEHASSFALLHTTQSPATSNPGNQTANNACIHLVFRE